MTKRLFTTLLALMLCTGAFAQGVDFRPLTFSEALAMSAKENKPIFLDCYTTWCGPCRAMAEQVFPQKEMGDFFNPNFISIKIDMEKGEGPELAERFGVRAYPTFVVIGPDGEMLHMIVGGGDGQGFRDRVLEAFDEQKAFGPALARYETGDRDRGFLLGLMNKMVENYNPRASEVAQELFATLSDEERVSPDNWLLFENYESLSAGSATERYLMDNLDRFRQSVGREKVDELFFTKYNTKLQHIIAGIEGSTADDVDRIAAEIRTLDLEREAILLAYVDFANLVISGDRDVQGYRESALRHNLVPEGNPFPNIYMMFRKDLTPEQLEEWKSWGRELRDDATNPAFIEALDMVLAQ